jgi:hypothetical protein
MTSPPPPLRMSANAAFLLWVIGWLALGVQAGLLGLSIVVVHWFLAGAGGVYSVELSKFDDALGL